MRACILSISSVHGPAELADTEAMNAIAPNTNNLEAVMIFTQLAHGIKF
jgi:hypothetical protein